MHKLKIITDSIINWITRPQNKLQDIQLNNIPPDKTYNYQELRELIVGQDWINSEHKYDIKFIAYQVFCCFNAYNNYNKAIPATVYIFFTLSYNFCYCFAEFKTYVLHM